MTKSRNQICVGQISLLCVLAGLTTLSQGQTADSEGTAKPSNGLELPAPESSPVLGDIPLLPAPQAEYHRGNVGFDRAGRAYNPARAGGYGGDAAGGIPEVVLFRPAERETIDALSEDLRIMDHILDRSLQQNLGAPGPNYRMGIPLLLNGNQAGFRPVYIEGFGALFHLRVNFPLLAPEAKEPTSPPPAASSDWEQARAEILGSDGPNVGAVWPEPDGKLPYDGERVTRLKYELLRALKNAANLRGVKEDENVAVIVDGASNPGLRFPVGAGGGGGVGGGVPRVNAGFGGAGGIGTSSGGGGFSTGTASFGGSAGGGGGWGGAAISTDNLRRSVLSIRVRKADAEAFAKGALSLKDFQSAAAINVYPGELPEALSTVTYRSSGRYPAAKSGSNQPSKPAKPSVK